MCDHQLCSHPALGSVSQSVREMDFERGIWTAALDGNVEKVKRFIENGTNPSDCDSSGYTALHYAARNGHIEVCKLLLKTGGNPNAQTPGGATPLHRAAFLGHTDIVMLLLQHAADPSLKDSDGKTPLHKAAEGQHLSTAKLMISNDLKQEQDNKGLIPADYIKEKNYELLDVLGSK